MRDERDTQSRSVGLGGEAFTNSRRFLARYVWSMILAPPVGLGPGRAHRFEPIARRRRLVHHPGPPLGMLLKPPPRTEAAPSKRSSREDR